MRSRRYSLALPYRPRVIWASIHSRKGSGSEMLRLAMRYSSWARISTEWHLMSMNVMHAGDVPLPSSLVRVSSAQRGRADESIRDGEDKLAEILSLHAAG